MSAKLHYVYDPLCGWCYGAEPLVQAAAQTAGIELVLHGGGLWPEPTQLPQDTRLYIQQADARIASTSGQPFGDAYLNGLLLDPELVLESESTISAVLAAKSIDPNYELPMLEAIQHAHYENGRHVVRPETLLEIAEECGIDRDTFSSALGQISVDNHILESRQFMSRVGASGFPAFALETSDGWKAVPHQQFSKNSEGFTQWLSQQAS